MAASGASFAQSSVSISGGMRVGYLNAAGVKSISDNQSSGNTVNFNVVEDLGGGLSFTGASQLRYRSFNGANSNTGSGDLFHLVAFGVKSSIGHIQAGRIGLDQMWGYSPFGSNGAHTNPATLGGATEDGQVRYTSPSMNGFNLVLAATSKGNTSGATKDGSQVILNYANGPIAASYVSEEVVTADATSSAKKYAGLGASYDLGVAKVMFISAKEKTAAGAVVTNGQSFGVSAPVGAFVLKAAMKDDKMTANNDKTSFGVDYALSKRTILGADFYKAKADTESSYWLGVRHSF